MSDGREEREDYKTRLEQERRENRDQPVEREELIDWEPERADS